MPARFTLLMFTTLVVVGLSASAARAGETLTIDKPTANATYKSGDQVIVSGSVTKAPAYVQVKDDKNQSESAYLNNLKWTTESPSQPGTSIYRAPTVTNALTPR